MSDQSNRSMQQGANTAINAGRGAVRGGKAAYRAGKTAVKAGKTFMRLPAPVQIGIAVALVIVMFAAVIVGGTSSTSMDETWYLTAENAIDKDNEANSPKTEDELTSVESEYNSVEKTSNLASIIHEVKEEDRRALEAQLQKTYPDKALTIECDTDTEEYYISDVFALSGSGSGSSASAAQAAVDWAIEKAKESEQGKWYYVYYGTSGTGKNGVKKSTNCPICSPNSASQGWQCIGFVSAAYFHGAGVPSDIHRSTTYCHLGGFGTGGGGGGGGTLDGKNPDDVLRKWKKRNGENWEMITTGSLTSGYLKDSELQAGDILLCYENGKSRHMALYAGDGKVVESSGGSMNGGKGGIYYHKGTWTRKRTRIAMRYTGGGSETVSTSGSAANQQVINGALAWARKIAADDSWTYGHGSFKCCICNNMKIKKFTCMPFVAAAYAHGGGDPIMMGNGKHVINLHDGNFQGNLGKIWKKVGLCKNLTISDLRPGDVVIKWSSNNESGHAWMYGGGNDVIEATSGAGIRVKSDAAQRLKRYGTKDGNTSKNYVMRYVGQGGSDSSTSSASATSGGMNAAEAIARCADATSWKLGTASSKYKRQSGGKAYGPFSEIYKKWYPNASKSSDKSVAVGTCCCHYARTCLTEAIGRKVGDTLLPDQDIKSKAKKSLTNTLSKYGFTVTEWDGKQSSLQRGDIISYARKSGGGHVFIYLGGGIVAEAGHSGYYGHKAKLSSGGKLGASSKKWAFISRAGSSTPVNVSSTAFATAGLSGTTRSANDLPSYKSVHILGEIKQSDGKTEHLKRRGSYQIGQSFALTDNGNFVVAWATQPSTTKVCASLYDSSGKHLDDKYVNGYHANASTVSKDGEIWIGGWLTGASNKVASLTATGKSLSSNGTKALPARNSSGLAYDRQTGKYILAAGGTIRIYDSSLKNCERKTYKKHGSAYQDVGAGGGIIYACHSVKKGNLKNGTGENYVDLFRESDGAYLGSYFLNYGELESCVIEKGELVLLIHVKGEGRCFIQWTGVNVLGGEGAGGFGFDSGALAGTTGISKSDLEILSAYSVSLANSELVFLEDAKQTTADDAITGRYFNKLESKLGSKAGKPVKLYWFGKDRGKADYEGDLKRKLKGAVLYDREYEISESGDSIKITLKQRKAHEIMRDAFGLDPNASYVNATTKMTATEITGSDSDSATGSISGSGSASSTQDGIQKSIEWARNIAADDRFTYGKGYGDYYDCPVCHGSTKKSELKYTCNPFVAAAFAHGTGDPLLMNHGNHKVRTSDWNFEGNRSKIWKKVGLCKDLSWPDIQPGDIFIQYASGVGGHACIYGGGDELIEATSGSGITDRKSGAKKRFQSYQKGSKNFVMRYIGTGGGSGTSSSGSTVQSIGGWTGKSGNGECYLGNAASTKNMSQSGDQDGKEVLVSKCGTNWDYVIRWSDASKALAASKIMYDACKNDHVGYNNQNKAKSTSFYKQLVANKGDASAISENCDTACSQMVAAILRYLGVDMNDYVDSKSLYNTLKKRSEFTVYSSEAYTKSTSKLRPGDILMRVNGNNHTAMVVQTKDGMEGVEAIQGGDGEVYTGLTGGTATNGEAGYTLAENTAQLLFNGKTEVRTINMGSSSMQDVVFGGYSNGGELTFPLPKGTWTFTSDRGWRWGRLHEGVDLGAAKGTPIYAAAAGTVVRSEYYSGYGNCIDIDHGGGMVTRYGHQSKLIAKKGDTVQAGQKIGEVGNTGHSFGNHLHFEVRINGKSVDPKPYIGMSGMKPQ